MNKAATSALLRVVEMAGCARKDTTFGCELDRRAIPERVPDLRTHQLGSPSGRPG